MAAAPARHPSVVCPKRQQKTLPGLGGFTAVAWGPLLRLDPEQPPSRYWLPNNDQELDNKEANKNQADAHVMRLPRQEPDYSGEIHQAVNNLT